jgi:predicted DNA-binding transcriptional regulator AlpA
MSDIAHSPQRRLIPDPQVCRRYGVHPSTLRNWDLSPTLGFPKPVKIRGRNYRVEPELDEFDQARADERELESATGTT